MHIFRLLMKAGAAQPTYPEGTEIAGLCMVDSQDTLDARQKACDRLFKLGWQSITFEQTILLSPESDISKFDAVMTSAFQDAKRLGMSVIEFPEPQSAT